MDYEPIIGLEVHVELRTERKMFCSCRADWFGSKQNTHVCPVCLGLPGALPVPNKQAIEWTLLIARALNCSINAESYFERKHYFYPDLPKGYQISQYHKPFGYDGHLGAIAIERVHLEEDTGKLIYKTNEKGEKYAEVDYNRSSVPLVEIVTKPVIHDSKTAVAYLKELRQTLLYLGVSDVDMEKGSMRCEPNISLRVKGKTELPPYKVEVKNINSFRFVQKAIDFELIRHETILENGETPKQETRRFVESKNTTEPMRSKEEARDYRYMPDPDIPPIVLSEDELKKSQLDCDAKELPPARRARYESYGLSKTIAEQLVEQKDVSDLFEAAIYDHSNDKTVVIKIANILINDKNARIQKPEALLAMALEATKEKTVDTALLTSTLKKCIADNPQVAADYKTGNTAALNVLVGAAMRELKGKADAGTVISTLRTLLS